MAGRDHGIINANEAYSKAVVLQRLGISQRSWDQMLNNGLPYSNVGHGKWVTGHALIEYLSRHSETKGEEGNIENT